MHAPPDDGVAVSVVICSCTMKRWRDLGQAVESVLAQSRPAHELVVVIDGEPELLERARAAFPAARVMASQEKRGISGARNTGLRHVSGPVVAFLDDDARADPGWLAAIAPWYGDPGVVGVGGHIEPSWNGHDAPRWLPPELNWVVGGTHRGVPTSVAPVRNVFGANMSFRRAALERIGGFAGGLGRIGRGQISCEETELSIRAARSSGGVVLHVPEARVEHSVPPEYATWRYLIWRCWGEGRSKAIVTDHVGTQVGLESERRYVTRVLPPAVAAGLRDALRGDLDGLRRAAAIVAALATTAAGYGVGRLSNAAGRPGRRR